MNDILNKEININDYVINNNIIYKVISIEPNSYIKAVSTTTIYNYESFIKCYKLNPNEIPTDLKDKINIIHISLEESLTAYRESELKKEARSKFLTKKQKPGLIFIDKTRAKWLYLGEYNNKYHYTRIAKYHNEISLSSYIVKQKSKKKVYMSLTDYTSDYKDTSTTIDDIITRLIATNNHNYNLNNIFAEYKHIVIDTIGDY